MSLKIENAFKLVNACVNQNRFESANCYTHEYILPALLVDEQIQINGTFHISLQCSLKNEKQETRALGERIHTQ